MVTLQIFYLLLFFFIVGYQMLILFSFFFFFLQVWWVLPVNASYQYVSSTWSHLGSVVFHILLCVNPFLFSCAILPFLENKKSNFFHLFLIMNLDLIVWCSWVVSLTICLSESLWLSTGSDIIFVYTHCISGLWWVSTNLFDLVSGFSLYFSILTLFSI